VKIGFHSPLPPARSGVADYSATLLQELRSRAQVLLNAAGPADIHLYHLGNNPLHRKMYESALREPGVVVLHDAVLNHFFLGCGDRDLYVREFVYNYGDWSRDLAEFLWRERSRSASDARYFAFPMLRRVVEQSLAIVVHNPGAAERVRSAVPGAPVTEIPHILLPVRRPSEAAVAGLWRRYDIRPGEFVFGVFGHLRESKRLLTVLRAFERVRRAGRQMRLLVAGSFVSRDLERAAGPWLSGVGTIRAPYLREDAFWAHAALVDACINLRNPGAGETSGIAIRMMALGKPVVVSNTPEVGGFPETVCPRIDTGVAEQEMLECVMLLLASRPELAKAAGAAAKAYVELAHSPASVANRYMQVLRNAADGKTFNTNVSKVSNFVE
jgi:glycosyltransferase involved in cell wall biosynthesis